MRKLHYIETVLVQLEENELGDIRTEILNLDVLPYFTAPDEDAITLTKDNLLTTATDL